MPRDLMILAALFCAGRLAGFVYWGIAGRNAGAWREIRGADKEDKSAA